MVGISDPEPPITDYGNWSRIPWESVETFPRADPATIEAWERALNAASTRPQRARALIGRLVATYWVDGDPTVTAPSELRARRDRDVVEAIALTESGDDARLRAEVLLGALYATWGPDQFDRRTPWLDELVGLAPAVDNEELQLRLLEWRVIDRLDHADLDEATRLVETFAAAAADTELVIFRRRELLWRANLAMLEGRIDEAVSINQDAISRWADVAGSPFSFQNVAITVAIERYLRRGLGDVIDAVHSIRASSPRVGTNWTVGLAFTLSEAGRLDDARELFEPLVVDGFAGIPRDLNWLVTMQLCGLIALALDHERAGRATLEQLRPFGHLDATHGSGYASYGPVARVVASLAARWGVPDESEQWFDLLFETRPPGPWTALARYDRASARSMTRPAEAIGVARRAIAELGELELTAWAHEAEQLELDLLRNGHGGPLAELIGDQWQLTHPSGRAIVAAGVGTAYLVALLSRPHRQLDIAELDRSAPPIVESRSVVTESPVDDAARSAYRQRLAQLEALDHPAPSEHDEADFLRRELAGAAYFVASSKEVERARVRVTKAIRRTIDRIGSQSAGLGTHLRESITTGRRCSYQPDDDVAWQLRGDRLGSPE